MHGRNRLLLLMCFVGCVGSSKAQSRVDISFIDPDRFVDAGEFGIRRDMNLGILRAQLERLGRTRLPQGQLLRVEILDVDLAGSVRLSATVRDIRVVTSGTDRPHISLRYTPLAGAQVLKSGTESLFDLGFLHRNDVRRRRSEPMLEHEQRLLERWFVRTVSTPATDPG